MTPPNPTPPHGQDVNAKYSLNQAAGPVLVIGIAVAAWRHNVFVIFVCGFLLLGNYMFHWKPKHNAN